MPRDIPVGNGNLLLCFDENYTLRDLYFPHVGQENHLNGEKCRFGVWIDNAFSWLDEEWKRDLHYEEDSLVTQVSLYNDNLGVFLYCRDSVDFHENIFVREIEVENMRGKPREIRLFFSQNFNISGNSVGDTAAFDPKTGAVVHYKGARYFLAGGMVGEENGLSQYAVGQKNIQGKEGAFRDAEDGHLSGNTIAQGSVDSVVALHLTVPPQQRKQAYYWIAAGHSWGDVRRLDKLVKHKHPRTLLKRTSDYWRLWVQKESPAIDKLPKKVSALYYRSLLVLRTQIDWEGGILAANDSDIIMFNRDTYSYIWPRDGALVANALDLAHYPILSQRFYEFASRVIEKEGYFLHKYNPDGTLASSWHPWVQEKDQLPIQEDETALIVWALWNHFVAYRDIEFIKPLYKVLVKSASDFMCRYRDDKQPSPLASYDLWEERRGVLSFTVGTVFGGLTAAALFCQVFGENDRAEKYRKAASEVRDAASTYLWREDKKRFCRMITFKDNGEIEADTNCDASLWGLFRFGMFSADDPKIVSTMKALREKLWLKTEVGGMARYEDDYYHRVSEKYPGNPWFICTMWLADYIIERAQKEDDMHEAVGLLEWVADHALPSGVLAEQVDPDTGNPLSVSPLTWSHATFVATCQRILGKMAVMQSCPKCGLSLIDRGEEDWLERLFSETCDSIRGICKVH